MILVIFFTRIEIRAQRVRLSPQQIRESNLAIKERADDHERALGVAIGMPSALDMLMGGCFGDSHNVADFSVGLSATDEH